MRMGSGARTVGRVVAGRAIVPAAVRLAHATDADPGPQIPLEPVPSTTRGRYSFSHLNLVVPDLPPPHRYLACMVLVGQSGTRVFDDDRAVHRSPRRTATTTVATGVTTTGAYQVHEVGLDTDLAPGRWHLGDTVEVTGSWPRFRAVLRSGDVVARLEVVCDGPMTWFARSPVYDHVGYPARATGTVTDGATATDVDAPCTLEYARATSPSAVVDRVVPPALKLPWDRFCYQVLALDAETLLLLTWVGVAGSEAFASVITWRRGARPERWCGPIGLEVLERREGGPASRCRWRWDGGELELRAEGHLHPAVGTGWLGGWYFAGSVGGRAVEGRAYGEWADHR